VLPAPRQAPTPCPCSRHTHRVTLSHTCVSHTHSQSVYHTPSLAHMNQCRTQSLLHTSINPRTRCLMRRSGRRRPAPARDTLSVSHSHTLNQCLTHTTFYRTQHSVAHTHTFAPGGQAPSPPSLAPRQAPYPCSRDTQCVCGRACARDIERGCVRVRWVQGSKFKA
jgi:hypothetical protein